MRFEFHTEDMLEDGWTLVHPSTQAQEALSLFFSTFPMADRLTVSSEMVPGKQTVFRRRQ